MAKPKTYVCKQCGEKVVYTEQTPSLQIGKRTRYFHDKCLNKYKEEKRNEEEQAEFRKKENLLLDKLVEVAGEIHEVPKLPDMAYQMPRSWYHVIQDWRNGSQRYTHNFKKKYKKGIPYDVLIEAYKLSKDAIRWSKMDKNFKDTQQEVRYGLAIVNSKIPDAMKKLQRDQHMEKVAKIRQEAEAEELNKERETVYKKQNKASYDISDLLS